MARSYLLWGPAGTGKTTFAIADATPEQPAWYAELEPGGFRRAARRLKLDEGAIQVESYLTPQGELESLLDALPILSTGGKVDIKYDLEGWTELLNRIVSDMMKATRQGQRPIFDTATRWWLIVRNAFQQMTQQVSGPDFDKLDQQKYTWPNKVHLQVHEFPIAYNQDVIWVSHQDAVFRSDPPVFKPDCWRELAGMVDVSLQFRIVGDVPTARIDKGAEVGMTLRNLDIPYPTLKKVSAILDVTSVLEDEGEIVEKDAEALLDVAKMRGLY